MGLFNIIGIMMKSKDLSNLIHQTKGFWNKLPVSAIHISFSLLKAPFLLKYQNMAPNKRYIIENYGACVGALSPSYNRIIWIYEK